MESKEVRLPDFYDPLLYLCWLTGPSKITLTHHSPTKLLLSCTVGDVKKKGFDRRKYCVDKEKVISVCCTDF